MRRVLSSVFGRISGNKLPSVGELGRREACCAECCPSSVTRFTVGHILRTSPFLHFLHIMRGIRRHREEVRPCWTSPVSLSGSEKRWLFPSRVILRYPWFQGVSGIFLPGCLTFLIETVIPSCVQPSVPGRLNHQECDGISQGLGS